jgi:PilZ domain
MAKKQTDLREILSDAHANFYLVKGNETKRLRLWEITENYIVVDTPQNAPMWQTVLGYIPTLDGESIYEIAGKVERKLKEDQMPNTICITIDPTGVKRVQRRLFQRFSFAPPIEITMIPESHGKTVTGYIVDISAGGLRVESRSELSANQLYTFQFEIELDDEIHSYAIFGQVLYELPTEHGLSYGIKFGRPEDMEMDGGEVPIESLDGTIGLLDLVNKLMVRYGR